MASFPLIYSRHLTIFGSCYCKNKLTSVSYASDLLLMINCVITLSNKVYCGTTRRHFDNVMTQFIINKTTNVQKTDVNLLIDTDQCFDQMSAALSVVT